MQRSSAGRPECERHAHRKAQALRSRTRRARTPGVERSPDLQKERENTPDPAGLVADQRAYFSYLDDLKRRVSVARADGELPAIDDLHTHEACPLSSGLLTGTTLMCQCCGSQFDITSAAILRGPATEPLATYEERKWPARFRSGSERRLNMRSGATPCG
jgi:nitrite reductase/ring-hydroxylating ferredoxin subunit